MINQGDQYSLPIKIMSNNTYLTPTDVDDVRIQVGTYLKQYSDSEITFDSTTNEWKFPLTEAMTNSFSTVLVPVQIGVKIGTEYMYSATVNENIGQSIIKETW